MAGNFLVLAQDPMIAAPPSQQWRTEAAAPLSLSSPLSSPLPTQQLQGYSSADNPALGQLQPGIK
ncbi:hypothetical protein CCM_02884 [Cordyceps militaris CM01]|uniref:Uncharacterized protein n=1 Tax=Cordyceps militaris (strain CM01) TaxID=983644 RepID=G3JCF2_CORMM|nr:uncharacterized protein CCM_02884 [Cordyceps militaris CM01]EGX94613.1 hypothetical protein CCM_02884 [Cordyceps militaris CM01]